MIVSGIFGLLGLITLAVLISASITVYKRRKRERCIEERIQRGAIRHIERKL